MPRQLKESTQVKNLSIPNASITNPVLTVRREPARLTLGGPNVNSVWQLEFIVIKYAHFVLTKSGSGETIPVYTPVGRAIFSGGVVAAEVQAAGARLKNKTEVEEEDQGPLTLAFQFVQPPLVTPGQTVDVEVLLEALNGFVPKNSGATLSQGVLTMGYLLQQKRGYGVT